MPNLRHNGRWVLDTAGSVATAGTFIRIMAICFAGANDADDCILHDGNGKVIWQCKLGTVATAGYQEGISFGNDGTIVDGLNLATIDDGILFVYLGKL